MTIGNCARSRFASSSGGKRRVGRREIDVRLGEPHDAAKRADRLVVDAQVINDKIGAVGAFLQETLLPGADHRKGEGRALAEMPRAYRLAEHELWQQRAQGRHIRAGRRLVCRDIKARNLDAAAC